MGRHTPYWQKTPPAPGIAASHPGQCGRCSGPIIRQERIVFSRGHAIHVRCASGADDE